MPSLFCVTVDIGAIVLAILGINVGVIVVEPVIDGHLRCEVWILGKASLASMPLLSTVLSSILMSLKPMLSL